MPASPALPALPHTQYTHTQSHNCRHGSRLGAGRRGWDAAEQRSRGRLAAAGRRVRVGEHAGLSGVATPLEPHPSAGGWLMETGREPRCESAGESDACVWRPAPADRQQQRRATSSSASRCRYEYGNDDGRLHQGKGSARASHPEAGPAHIRATSLPLSVPRRSLLSRSYLGWGIVPPFSSWRVFAEGAACG